MKTIKRWWLALLSAAMLTPQANYGQQEEPFSLLNLDDLSTGILYSDGQLSGLLLHPSAADTIEYSDARQALFSITSTSSSMGSLPAFEEVRENALAENATNGTIPIVLFDLAYESFSQEAYDSSWIAVDEGVFLDESPIGNSIYAVDSLVGLWIPQEDYYPGIVNFVFSQDFFVSNRNAPELISIDFDDGLGFQDITLGSAYSVDYTNLTTNRHIRLKLWRNNSVEQRTYEFRSAGGASTFPEPEVAPWGSIDPIFPWLFETEYNGETLKASAYTLLSDDGVFDKPFVFVEGIDFGRNKSALRNGTFGWHEFSSGASSSYDFLEDMPLLLNPLRENGYDLILLDFEDGANYIEKNTQLLVELVHRINTYKIGDENLIITGASMGGQITRRALTQMEADGEKHCARLWISMDSPHQGANIPIGLQHMIDMLSVKSAKAANFKWEYLNRPAARQMLFYQLPEINSLFSSYYTSMNNMGYPKELRTFGIANGSGIGANQGFDPSVPLVNYECNLLGVTLAKFLMLQSPGDPFHTYSNGTSNFVGQVVMAEKNSIIEWDNFQLNSPITIDDQHRNIPYNFIAFDNASGGYRKSIEELVESLNIEMANAGIPGSCSSTIMSNQYVDRHNFIPTYSALGIDYLGSPNVNINELLDQGNLNSPFDRVHFSPSGNEAHSEVNPVNISMVLEEVLLGENKLPAHLFQLSPNNGSFNFGLPQHYLLKSTKVDAGGKLMINANQPLHFDDTDEESTLDHFVVKTDHCGSHVEIGNQGLLLIGSTSQTAALEIRSESLLEVTDGGHCKVEEGSTLRIKSDADFSLSGTLTIEEGARLIIEEGATWHIDSNSKIYLKGDAAVVELRGQLAIAPGATFSLLHPNVQSGKLVVYPETPEITGNWSSKIDLVGDGLGDVLLVLTEGANFKTSSSFGNVDLAKCGVYFNASGLLHVPGHFKAQKVNFLTEAYNTSAGVLLNGYNKIESCSFWNTPLVGSLDGNYLNVLESAFYEENGGIELNGGGLQVQGCTFENSKGIASEQLQNLSWLKASTFWNDYQSSGMTAFRDHSEVLVEVKDCNFKRCAVATEKWGGELRLRCNEFFHNDVAVIGGEQCILNLSTDIGGGYNRFWGSGVNIHLEGADALNLMHGYNVLNHFQSMNIDGYLIGNCTSCDYLIEAHRNVWFDQDNPGDTPMGMGPNAQSIDVLVIDEIYNCQNTISSIGCVVTIIDEEPNIEEQCTIGDPLTSGKKKNKSVWVEDEIDASQTPKQQHPLDEIESPTVGLDDLRAMDGVAVFPNPTSGSFVLQNLSDDDVMSYCLFDVTGSRIVCEPLSLLPHSDVVVDLPAELSAGMYFLELKRQNSREVIRVNLKK